MMRNNLQTSAILAVLSASVVGMSNLARAVLYEYEPFNYIAGQNLGGVDSDPDPNTTAGSPIGQVGSYAADFGNGTAFNWYARGTTSNYQSTRDTVVSSGNLSYAGLATSQGNSVSYGSGTQLDPGNPANAAANAATNTENTKLYADSFQLPVSVTSGNLYASFIVRIKSRVYDGTASTAYRHVLAGFVTDSSNNGNSGGALTSQGGTGVDTGGTFWIRRDPVDATLNTTNFSPGKLSSDGIGPGAPGDSAGWQHSGLGSNVENNQFGVKGGQTAVTGIDGASISTEQTYFVVLKYAFDVMTPDSGLNNNQADTVSLWMNPGSGTLGSATGEADASQAAAGNLGSYFAAVNAFGTATHDVTAINSFALFGHRQNVGQTVAVDFDELRIGTTWQDVTPSAAAGIPGDFNNDGKVDAGDYATWRKNDVANATLANDNGVGNQAARFTLWRANFGKPPGAGRGAELGGNSDVPEPSSLALLVLISAASCGLRRRTCR
jgi:hypothetical protein